MFRNGSNISVWGTIDNNDVWTKGGPTQVFVVASTSFVVPQGIGVRMNDFSLYIGSFLFVYYTTRSTNGPVSTILFLPLYKAFALPASVNHNLFWIANFPERFIYSSALQWRESTTLLPVASPCRNLSLWVDCMFVIGKNVRRRWGAVVRCTSHFWINHIN